MVHAHHSKKRIKVLSKVLKLIAIIVKNNKENQVHAFKRILHILQNYIGMNQSGMDVQVIITIVEDCEEILLNFDKSLDIIIEQLLKPLRLQYNEEEKWQKFVILDILKLFCTLKGNGIPGTQKLIHDILFESEQQGEILVPWKLKYIYIYIYV